MWGTPRWRGGGLKDPYLRVTDHCMSRVLATFELVAAFRLRPRIRSEMGVQASLSGCFGDYGDDVAKHFACESTRGRNCCSDPFSAIPGAVYGFPVVKR